MEYKLVIGFVVLAAIVILYKLFKRPDNKFDRELSEILTSDKYKVKGQYDYDK